MSKVDQFQEHQSCVTNKDLYRDICKNNSNISLFSMDWWIDSVADDGSWDVAIYKKNDNVIAALPFYIKKKGPFTLLTMPKLTQNFQIWINYPANISDQRKLDFEMDAVNGVVKLLPKADYSSFNIHGVNENLLPFQWGGFSETALYTYVVKGLEDLDEVFSRFDSSMRNKVRKAEKIVEVKFIDDVSEFYSINKKTFDRQNMDMPYGLEFLSGHDKVLSEKGARKIFVAADDSGAIHSALYLTWDSKSSYVHMVGEDPELRSSGAGIKLIWEAIKFTKNTLGLDCLDYEGSMIKSVELVRRNCAGQQRIYSRVSKCESRILRAALAIRDTVR